MKLGADSKSPHLTYCLNVHPGETWAENFAAIRTHACAVRDRLDGMTPFGLGLRIGHRAALELSQPARRRAFVDWMKDENIYAFTINGFPYGDFHGRRVKEQVYEPDWSTIERRDYTLQLIDILAVLLPDQQEGSISTVPLGYAAKLNSADKLTQAASHLAECALTCHRLYEQTGRCIHVGLEPEPTCRLETTPQLIDYFETYLWRDGLNYILAALGCTNETAELILRRHIGVCLDTCHVALQFEEPAAMLREYNRHGIRLSKIQLSAALSCQNSVAARAALTEFNEPVYLHQVRTKTPDGAVDGWTDLPEGLAALTGHPSDAPVRVHFHVPLYWQGAPGDPDQLQSTTGTLSAEFWAALRAGVCPHLEIETYTFDVLPASLRTCAIETHIEREYRWVIERLGAMTSD